MADFNEYIAADGRCGDVDAASLDDLLARYEWFSAARTVRAHLRGTTDPRSAVMTASRGVSSLDLKPIDISRLLGGNEAVGAAACSDAESACGNEAVGAAACSDAESACGNAAVGADRCPAAEPENAPSAATPSETDAADSRPVSAESAQDDVIERFLQLDDYRIVADDNTPDEEILTEAQLSDEDDVVSEELAEVYLSQGLRDEACAIYRKLSLLNPKKSVYFAEIIEKIENNN